QRGCAQQVDGAVGADQPAAGQRRGGECNGEGEGGEGSGEATHGLGPLVRLPGRTAPPPREFPVVLRRLPVSRRAAQPAPWVRPSGSSPRSSPEGGRAGRRPAAGR